MKLCKIFKYFQLRNQTGQRPAALCHALSALPGCHGKEKLNSFLFESLYIWLSITQLLKYSITLILIHPLKAAGTCMIKSHFQMWLGLWCLPPALSPVILFPPLCAWVQLVFIKFLCVCTVLSAWVALLLNLSSCVVNQVFNVTWHITWILYYLLLQWPCISLSRYLSFWWLNSHLHNCSHHYTVDIMGTGLMSLMFPALFPVPKQCLAHSSYSKSICWVYWMNLQNSWPKFTG